MTTFKELGAEVTEKTTEIVTLLKTIDEQVEVLYEALKNPQVPEEVAAEIRTGLEAVKTAAAAVATDDEAPVVGGRRR